MSARKSVSIDGALISKYKAFAGKFGVTLEELIHHSLSQHYRAALEPRKHATRIVIKSNAKKKVKATKKKKVVKAAKKKKATSKKKTAPVAKPVAAVA